MRIPVSYANVVSTLALALVLSGSAYAAAKLPKNSVGTKQLKANAVTTAKVKDGSLGAADLAPGVVPPAQPPLAGTPAGGGLTGTYPNPSVNVGALSGVLKGQSYAASTVLATSPFGTPQPLLTVPGVGTLSVGCRVLIQAGNPVAFRSQLSSAGPTLEVLKTNLADGDSPIVAAATVTSGSPLDIESPSATASVPRQITLATLAPPLMRITISSVTKRPGGSQCQVSASAVVSP